MGKRINKPQHLRQVLGQQLNELLLIEPKSTKERIEIARAVAYLSSVALTAIKDGEMEERIQELEKLLNELGGK